LKKVNLLGTDLYISRVGFGCGPLGSNEWGHIDQKDLMRVVRKALDLGVNYFDTADVYGLGNSELLLSKALGKEIKQAVISTKFGVNWINDINQPRAKTFYDSSPRRVKEALESSLKRLRIDCIPLYFIHWPDKNTPFSDTLKVLQDAKKDGKIMYLGLSNFSLPQIEEINKEFKVTAIQSQFSLISNNIDIDLINFCKKENINILVHGALAQGLLSGNYLEDIDFNEKDNRRKLEHFSKSSINKYSNIFSKLNTLSQKYTVSYSQLALRWVLEKEHVRTAICGIKNEEQLKESSSCLDWEIQKEDLSFFKETK
tara:strand:+ start:1390 stop:2331 length:942 start_codon:yes stop_codon:yes gene_type:complete